MHATRNAPPPASDLRHDWRADEVRTLFTQPFNDLLFEAQRVHRAYFDPNEVQLSTLLNIKTGGCPEDCAYCPQSARFDTGVEAAKVLDQEAVMQAARAARAAGATRFCMGAAWRAPKDRDLDQVIPLIEGVRSLGMETCVTLGMLSAAQAARLAAAGLDYYNHNLDTSPEFYGEIISTRTYEDRLRALARGTRINVCCARIVGLGESVEDRAELLRTPPTCRNTRSPCPSTCWCASRAHLAEAGHPHRVRPHRAAGTAGPMSACPPAAPV